MVTIQCNTKRFEADGVMRRFSPARAHKRRRFPNGGLVHYSGEEGLTTESAYTQDVQSPASAVQTHVTDHTVLRKSREVAKEKGINFIFIVLGGLLPSQLQSKNYFYDEVKLATWSSTT